MRMSSFHNECEPRLIAELKSKVLIQNYDWISGRVPEQAIIPMVKANAYGHGADWVAKTLLHKKSLYGFGVATLEEGMKLRKGLTERGRKTRILVFSGATPWREEIGHYCEKYSLTPAITSYEDWVLFLREKWPSRIPYELKFNTGMNRLGIPFVRASRIAKELRHKPSLWHPTGILSHLALGEEPENPLSLLQLDRFKNIKFELASLLPTTHFHLGNSAAVWLEKKWQLKGLTDAVRPGIGLYGIPPWMGAPSYGVAPVLTLKAHVIAIHNLKQGEKVGYGGRYTVNTKKGDSPVQVGILSAGYADGIHRLLGGRGRVWIKGVLTQLIGSVSMDLCAIRCPSGTRVGDWATLMGQEIDPWIQAKEAETIPYELLTSVSTRVQRIYD